jgi:hypothetical protein
VRQHAVLGRELAQVVEVGAPLELAVGEVLAVLGDEALEQPDVEVGTRQGLVRARPRSSSDEYQAAGRSYSR